jgi:hypothetical protein
MSSIEGIILSPAERYIHLSSEYANENLGNTADCTFRVNAPVTAANEEYCMLIGLHNATIPHTWYNVVGTRWLIYLGYGGVDFITGTIPEQNYTASSLASAMTTSVNNAMALAGLGTTFLCTYDSATNFYTFTNTVVTGVNPWYFADVENNVYLELGLRTLYQKNASLVSSQNIGGVYTLVPEAMVDLSAFHGIYVNILGFASNSLVSYGDLNIASVIARVPVKNPFGAIETYEPENITYTPVPNAALTNLHVTLSGDNGRQLNLNGVNWTMTLHVKYAAIRTPVPSTERLFPNQSFTQTQMFGGRRVI